MDGFLIGSLGIGIVIIGNIGAFAYCYGKLSQKVDDMSKRLERVEKSLNGLLTK